MTLEVGQVFAGYTIVRVLGAGGMGTGVLGLPSAVAAPGCVEGVAAGFDRRSGVPGTVHA